MKPIVEVMWADFLLVALDQIVNQAANIRYITQPLERPFVAAHPARRDSGLVRATFPEPGSVAGAYPGNVELPATPQDAFDLCAAP